MKYLVVIHLPDPRQRLPDLFCLRRRPDRCEAVVSSATPLQEAGDAYAFPPSGGLSASFCQGTAACQDPLPRRVTIPLLAAVGVGGRPGAR